MIPAVKTNGITSQYDEPSGRFSCRAVPATNLPNPVLSSSLVFEKLMGYRSAVFAIETFTRSLFTGSRSDCNSLTSPPFYLHFSASILKCYYDRKTIQFRA